MRCSYFVLLLALGTALSLTAMDTAQTEIVGCLSRLPAGTLQLGAAPSGQSYALHGNERLLEQHIGQLVRITGRAEENSSAPGVTVDSVHALGGSCSAVLPPTRLEPVAGKVGADVTATSLATTATMDQTTPGFQTEASVQGAAANHLARPNYAPIDPDYGSESAAAADINAQAAT